MVLLERSPKAGEPNFSSAGSPIETVAEFDLRAKRWRLPGQAADPRTDLAKEWTYDRPVGHVYDFRKLKCGLMDQAQAAGAEIRLGTAAKGITVLGDSTSRRGHCFRPSVSASHVLWWMHPTGRRAGIAGPACARANWPRRSPGWEILSHNSSTHRIRNSATDPAPS